ncbi:MAG: right-handed parallel beta-helix repeat-containing protein [Dehalococcoidia bacterium]
MRTMTRWSAMAVAVLVVSFLALGSLSQPASATPTTLVVDVDGHGSASNCNAGDVAYTTIQAAIDAAASGDIINVCPGTYNQDQANLRNPDTGGAGSNNFNIFVGKSLTIQGVNASGVPITDYHNVAAFVSAKRRLPTFGASTIFVQADGVTITGLDITGEQDDDYWDNKTLEVVGDAFTLKDCALHALDTTSSLYFDDRHFNAGTMTSHVQSYDIEGNLIDGGDVGDPAPSVTGIRISSGPGWSGNVSNRVIKDNTLDNNCDAIAFVGPGAEGWDVYPVGAATITGNSFSRSAKRHVVAWGQYLGGPGYANPDWQSIVANNTFDEAAVTWTPGGDAQPWTSGSFIDVRGIYSSIQRYAVNKAQPGDTVQVLPGTYNEQVIINQPLILEGAGEGATVIAPSPIAVNTTRVGGSAVAGIIVVDSTTGVTIRDLTVDGAGNALTACDPPALMGVYWRNASGTIENSEVRNIEWGSGLEGCQGAIGIFAEGGGGGGANVTISDNSVHDVQKNGITALGSGMTATISGNTVVGWGPTDKIAQNGIQLSDGAGGSITDNDVSLYDYTPSTWAAAGILVTQAADGVVVTGNNVHDSMEGLFIVNYSTPTMKNMVISGNTVTNSSDTGVYLLLVDSSEVSDNAIAGPYVGLWLADSSDISTDDNNISDNDYGVVVDGDSHNDTFTSNDIVDNAAEGVIVMPYNVEPSGLVFRCNSITGNGTYGIDNMTGNVVDAINNWWGDAPGGPANDGESCNTATGSGDKISCNVLFEWWLTGPDECTGGVVNTPTPTPTETLVPTATYTPTPTETLVPTATYTPTPTETLVPTETYTPAPTETLVPTATYTPTPTETLIPTETFTPVSTEASGPTETFTPTPTSTHTPTPSNTPTPTQTVTPTVCPGDSDCDGVPDRFDNCPTVYNPDQLNTDAKPYNISPASPGIDVSVPNSDRLGDACDSDIDNDYMLNTGTNPTLGIPGEDVGCGSGPTNPKLADTDGDTVLDGYECLVGSDPNNPHSKPSTSVIDSDHDGVPDNIEVLFGSDPHNPDTDGDGILDGVEIKGWGTSPILKDSNFNGCDDNIEIADVNGDYWVNTTDLLIVAKAVGHQFPYNADFDMNKDGTINVTDLLIVARQLGKKCTPH